MEPASKGTVSTLRSVNPQMLSSFQKTTLLYQLHGFSDASEKSYAAVIYLRIVYTDGSVDNVLMPSKTSIAG